MRFILNNIVIIQECKNVIKMYRFIIIILYIIIYNYCVIYLKLDTVQENFSLLHNLGIYTYTYYSYVKIINIQCDFFLNYLIANLLIILCFLL